MIKPYRKRTVPLYHGPLTATASLFQQLRANNTSWCDRWIVLGQLMVKFVPFLFFYCPKALSISRQRFNGHQCPGRIISKRAQSSELMEVVEKEVYCALYSQWNMYLEGIKIWFISISGGTKGLSGMTEAQSSKSTLLDLTDFLDFHTLGWTKEAQKCSLYR